MTHQSGLPDFSLYKIPKWGLYNGLPQHIPNCLKYVKQMAAKYTKWKISKFSTLPKCTQSGGLVWKHTIWQPWHPSWIYSVPM
jgi:hypothetical protein